MNMPAMPARGSRIAGVDSGPEAFGAGQSSSEGESGPGPTDLVDSGEAGDLVQSVGEDDEEYEPL